jgi:hypothetical protein
MRKTIHHSVFVGTDLKEAATKFRFAVDRQEFFDDGKEWEEYNLGVVTQHKTTHKHHHHGEPFAPPAVRVQ